jgi:hypothetical protein
MAIAGFVCWFHSLPLHLITQARPHSVGRSSTRDQHVADISTHQHKTHRPVPNNTQHTDHYPTAHNTHTSTQKHTEIYPSHNTQTSAQHTEHYPTAHNTQTSTQKHTDLYPTTHKPIPNTTQIST